MSKLVATFVIGFILDRTFKEDFFVQFSFKGSTDVAKLELKLHILQLFSFEIPLIYQKRFLYCKILAVCVEKQYTHHHERTNRPLFV